MARFNFEDELGGLDDASLMDVLGLPTTPSATPAPPPPVFAATQAPAPALSSVAASAAPASFYQPDQGLASLVQAAPAPQPAFVVAPAMVSAPASAPTVSLADQILSQWKSSGYGSQIAGVSAEDRANALANQLKAMGVQDLSQLGYGSEARYLGGDSRAKAGEIVDWSKYQGAPTQTYDYLTYGGKNIGYLGGATPTGVDQSLIQLMDPTGKGNVKFTPVRNADGSISFQPKWEASADATVNAILGTMLTSAIAPGLSSALGGGALGAAGAGAASGAIQAGVSGGDILQGALRGGIGGGLGSLASGVVNPIASQASSAVGGGALGDALSGAIKGAVSSGTGALIGGKSLGDALLSGAVGGGTSAGIGSLVGSSGLPTEVAKVVAPALTAAVLGKDPSAAAVNALIGQIVSGEPSGSAGAMTSGEEEERKGAGETYDLLKQLPDNKATTNAVETILKGQDTTVGSGDDLTGGVSNEDLDTLLGTGLTGAGTTSGAGTSAGDEQTGGTLLDQLTAAGVDTGTAGTSTGYTGEDTGADTGEGGEGADTSEGGEGGDSGDVNKNTLSEQAKFLESNVEDQDVVNQLLKDYAVDSDQLLGGIGNIGEDFTVTDKGTIKSTYSGEEGYFDADGNFVTYDVRPPYTSGGTGGTGGGAPTKTTKPTTPTRPTTAQSTFDPALLFALSSMLGQKPETPRERENAARIAAKSAFGGLPYQDIVDAYNDIYGA